MRHGEGEYMKIIKDYPKDVGSEKGDHT